MENSKYRNKVLKHIKIELKRIYAQSNSFVIRRSVRNIIKDMVQLTDFCDNYKSETGSWKTKNRSLARAVQSEKESANRLLQEKIEIQGNYHDLLKDHAILKKELDELEKTVFTNATEFQDILDKLVEFSNDFSILAIKNNALHNRIKKKREANLLPRNLYGNINFGNNMNQPVFTINPMIKACVIQKPTISIRRIPFSSEKRNSMFEYVNVSSPIMEECEESVDTPKSMSVRRESDSGHAINIRARQQSPVSYEVEEVSFNDPLSESDNSGIRKKPVVKLEDVARMLQNTSVQNSEANEMDFNLRAQGTSVQFSPEVIHNRSSLTRKSISTNIGISEGEKCALEKSSTGQSQQQFGLADRSAYSYRTTELFNSNKTNRTLFEADSSDDLGNCTLRKLCCEPLSSNGSTGVLKKEIQQEKLFESRSKRSLLGTRKSGIFSKLNSFPYDSSCSIRLSDECPSEILSLSTIDQSQIGIVKNITSRRRPISTPRNHNTRFSETKDGILEQHVNMFGDNENQCNRTRKSARLSSKKQNDLTVNDESSSKKHTKKRDIILTLEMSQTNNTHEVSGRCDTRKKYNVKTSEQSIISLDGSNDSLKAAETTLSSRPMRSVRNRANISYGEPSIKRKLRR